MSGSFLLVEEAERLSSVPPLVEVREDLELPAFAAVIASIGRRWDIILEDEIQVEGLLAFRACALVSESFDFLGGSLELHIAVKITDLLSAPAHGALSVIDDGRFSTDSIH